MILFSSQLDAFLNDYESLSWHVSRDPDCQLKVRKDTSISSGLGFAFRKGFQWLPNFNQAVLRYRESDELQTIHQKWISYDGGCNNKPDTVKIQLGINHFGGLVLILSICIISAFPLLIPEHLYMRYLYGTLGKRFRGIFCMENISTDDNGQNTNNQNKNQEN